MSIDLLSAKVVLDEEILSSIDNSFGSITEGYTKDEKIMFILNFDRASRIARFLNENPDILQKQRNIYSMILKKAQESWDWSLEKIMEDKIIELADYFISENTTYREAKIACEKLFRQVSHEIELRALESKTV